MINIGFYIPTLGDEELLVNCLNEIERGLRSGLLSDASIFYDNPGFINRPLECGVFNSTDLWHFKGKLVAISPECAIKSLNIINNIDIFFGYGWGSRDVFSTLKIVSDKNVNTICRTEEISKDFYRITGKQSVGVTDNLQGVIEMITT